MTSLTKIIWPQKSNQYQPWLLQEMAIFGMLFLIILSFTASNIWALFWQESEWLRAAVLPAVIVEKTNDERSDLELATLKRSVVLDQAAQKKAEDMARYEYFAHYSPAGVSPWYWFDSVGYVFAHAGENLAVHFTDSSDVVDAWMQSPTHRANIVNSNYTEIGVGTAKGEYEGFSTVFVVQLFGTPGQLQASSTPLSSNNADDGESMVDELTVLPVDTRQVAGVTAAEVVSEPDQLPQEILAPISVMPEIEPVLQINDTTFYQESFLATSSGLTPVLTATNENVAPQSTWWGVMTSPARLLQIFYLVVGAGVATSLFLSIMLAAKYHEPRRIWSGVALLGLMSLLFFVHLLITQGVLIA